MLGACHNAGHGLRENPAEAARWYRKAAERGYFLAQVALAARYRDGRRVPQDAAEALAWLKKAAEQNYPAGQHELGKMYRQGEGVAKDPVEAVKWFCAAAERGYGSSPLSLKTCTKLGREFLSTWANQCIGSPREQRPGMLPALPPWD